MQLNEVIVNRRSPADTPRPVVLRAGIPCLLTPTQAEDMLVDALERIAELERQLAAKSLPIDDAKLAEAVERMEWSGRSGFGPFAIIQCPWCHQTPDVGHSSRCMILELKAVVAARAASERLGEADEGEQP